jgi:hemerythrin-like metal-binding protein
MSRGYKPKWLYESLPHVYLTSGVLTVVWLRNPFAVLSGLLLVSAGAAVLRMRHRFRRAMAADVGEAAWDGRFLVPPESGLSQLAWRPQFEIGHPLIDEHHRELFARCNQLIDDIQTDKATGDIELRLYELLWAFEAHCEAEHKLLARAGDPLSDDEVDAYEGMLSDAKLLRERYHQGALTMAELVRFIAYEVLVEHVMGSQELMGAA